MTQTGPYVESPTHSSQVFRTEAGHHSEVMPVTPRRGGKVPRPRPAGQRLRQPAFPRSPRGGWDAGEERADHATITIHVAAAPRRGERVQESRATKPRSKRACALPRATFSAGRATKPSSHSLNAIRRSRAASIA